MDSLQSVQVAKIRFWVKISRYKEKHASMLLSNMHNISDHFCSQILVIHSNEFFIIIMIIIIIFYGDIIDSRL